VYHLIPLSHILLTLWCTHQRQQRIPEWRLLFVKGTVVGIRHNKERLKEYIKKKEAYAQNPLSWKYRLYSLPSTFLTTAALLPETKGRKWR
jgi:hypothetical protein